MGTHHEKITKPKYRLADLKRIVRSRRQHAFTSSAIDGIVLLGMSVQDAIDCIDNLRMNCFYKSMPSKKDPGFFQDVYHGKHWDKEIYIKFTWYSHGPVVISFKER